MNSKFEIEDGGKIMTEIFENGMWRRVGNISLRSYEDFKKRAIVFGAGGFIGSHLVKRLKKMGYWVRGVDLKYPEFCSTVADDFIIGDLRYREVVDETIEPFIDEVYQLAADMGGAGFVFVGTNDFDIMHNSSMINLNTVEICAQKKIKKIFYSSSACMYPQYNQCDPNNPKCSEISAYPANPDSEYGWEKLFSERLYLAYNRKTKLDVRIARFHNIFGPEGTWIGGREKAPAALCRKIAEAKDGDIIEIWGDGKQTRSFLWIDECIDGILRLMKSDFTGPVNIGSDEMVSINQLAEMIMRIANKKLKINHITGPLGVRGRNSDNKLIFEKLGWKPRQLLEIGMKMLYRWIDSQVNHRTINLIIQYFVDDNRKRQEEYHECIRRNLKSPLIKKIYNIQEGTYKLPKEFLKHPKMVNITGNFDRMTFRYAFEFANKHLNGEIVAIANLDIIFDDTAIGWSTLASFFTTNPDITKFVALSRHETDVNGKAWTDPAAFCGQSQDAWVFKSPIVVYNDYLFCVGNSPQAENVIARNLVDEGVIVANMGLSWRVLHLDRVRFGGGHSGGRYIVTKTTDHKAEEMTKKAIKLFKFESVSYNPCPYFDWKGWIKNNNVPALSCTRQDVHTHIDKEKNVDISKENVIEKVKLQPISKTIYPRIRG